MDSFGKDQLVRYSRQILLPELGLEGQLKLKQGRILVIGAGGLGSPALYYLAAAGIGKLGIADFDKVDESNLQRQILYTVDDIGAYKTEAARRRLQKLNTHVQIDVHNLYLNSDNALDILSGYDVIIDGSDSLATRYLVNDACVLLGKTLIYGAIFQFEGQVSVFNELTPAGARGPNYRDLFPQPPPPEMVPSCNTGGVLGVLPGIIGSMQANEAIKVIAGMGSTLTGRLLIFDALDFTTRFLNIKSLESNPVSGVNPSINKLIDYEGFCNSFSLLKDAVYKKFSTIEVKDLINKGQVQLVDVREKFEHGIVNIGGVNIPLNTLDENSELIEKIRPVVLYCKSGQRSKAAAIQLSNAGFKNVGALRGGLLAWKNDIDPDIELY